MALITLVGDSDGDLHTAALHNSKFGAIASVLNGNVDHANLAFPYTGGSYNFGCDGTTLPVQFYVIGAETSGTIVASSAVATAGIANVLKASWIKVPSAITISRVVLIAEENTSPLTSGENYSIKLQKASSLTGTYSTVASVDYDFYGAPTSGPVETALTVSSPAIDQNNYIRLMLKNPDPFTSSQVPNSFSVLVTYKTLTVA
tara:strand:- start:2426 stop:3034 length:609 start_codon:yes stop_codon:yes gene_type:complete